MSIPIAINMFLSVVMRNVSPIACMSKLNNLVKAVATR